MSQEYNKYAFISYNHKDVKWAKWLHKKLESYKLPSEIHNEFEDSRYMRPVFRDQEDLNTGVLSDTLRNHLESSKYLIVICSPNSAGSVWVNDEVRAFIEMGRLGQIIPFIINGSTHKYEDRDITNAYPDECYPLALRQLAKEDRNKELLGVNVAEVGRSKAFIRVVSKMLDVSFDTLWKRHQRERIRRIVTLSIAIPVVSALIYWFAMPVNMSITLKDQPTMLPGMENGTLTINGSEHIITNPDTTVNIEFLGYYRLKSIPVTFKANRYYQDIQTEIKISASIMQNETIQLQRDSTFEYFKGQILDEYGEPVPNATIDVEGRETTTNDKGEYSIRIPLNEQTETKRLVIKCEGYEDKVHENESAGYAKIPLTKK